MHGGGVGSSARRSRGSRFAHDDAVGDEALEQRLAARAGRDDRVEGQRGIERAARGTRLEPRGDLGPELVVAGA